MEYLIYLTNDCNLDCKYCSVQFDMEKYKIPMTPAYTNEELLDFILRTQKELLKKEVTICFFGGEPTLEYPKMQELMDYFKRKLSDFLLRFCMYTNGLLLDKMPKETAQNFDLIKVSINYEKVPAHHLKNSYFSTIMENVQALKRTRDIPLNARLTITEYTSLYTEVMQMHGFFDTVYWQIENCEALEDFNDFYDTYTFEAGLLFQYWVTQLEKGTMLQFIPFMAVLKFMFYHDRDASRFCCTYGDGMVYVQTDGNCYACSDSVAKGTHKIGDIYGGVALGNCSLNQLVCADCEYRPLCMGRCGRMHKEFSAKRVSEYCSLNKYVFNLFIERKDFFVDILKKYPYYEQQLSSWLIDTSEYTS